MNMPKLSFELEFLIKITDYEQKNLANPGINCDDFEFFKNVHCLSLGYVYMCRKDSNQTLFLAAF